MRIIFVVAPALLYAGIAVAQSGARPDPMDPRAKVPPVEFRSALDGYRPYADSELRDWRKSNEEVGAAGGHAGQRPGKLTSKPQPGNPAPQGHGEHK
jgi:hypothetical protein